MIDKILKAIKNNDITTYSIRSEQRNTSELYFIKKELSTTRQTKITTYFVNIYNEFLKDNKKMLGEASILLYEGMDEDKINKEIKEAYISASYVCNPFYELPKNASDKVDGMDLDLSDTANKVAEALFLNDNNTMSYINSAEIYVTKTNIRIINSNNVDVTYSRFNINGEYVVQQKEPTDIEIHNDFNYNTLDTENLAATVKKDLENAKFRSYATKNINTQKCNVILSGKCIYDLLCDIYLWKADAASIYSNYSGYKIGENVQGDDIIGDKLNIDLVSNVPYNIEGIKIKNRTLIKDGKLESIIGNSRFCNYLNIEPTGQYSQMNVKCGVTPIEDMKKDVYLEALVFSAFQVDPMSGYFGGELRLGLYHDGENVIPVTGCSISGNILDAQKDLTLSKERQEFAEFTGPYSILFKNVSVGGK